MKTLNQMSGANRRLIARVIALIPLVALALASAEAGTITKVASTIPSNGDLNPYGVASVPTTTGSLTKGNILVSNFNNSQNLQGTGTTIVQITPSGAVTLFAQIDASTLPGPCPGGVGLTTALVALRTGWVIVGSVPTTDGMSDTVQAGCLLVLNSGGQVVETFFGSLINGPWDMAAFDGGRSVSLFVTNVLNGTVAGGGKIVHQGTVLRLDLNIPHGSMPNLQQMTVIGSGFAERTDPNALVIGPTGLALSHSDRHDTDRRDDDGHGGVLYVADTLNNRIVAIEDPLRRNTSDGTGTTVSQGGALNGPLGLEIATNGDILTVNSGDGYLVETKVEGHHGHQIRKVLLDDMGTGAGALFGLIDVAGQGIYFVDDNENALNLFH
ncbi:MAG: hypothetical protein WBQ10_15520 [Terriglobales bacterium]